MFVLLMTGPPGAGKSRVLSAVHDSLADAGVRNALVEVDELERSYPPLARAEAMGQLERVCDGLRAAGHDLLLVTATVEDDAYAEAVFAAAGADERLLVRLEASPRTLERRVREREPANWSGLERLVGATHELARTMPSLSGVDLVLSTEGQEAEQVAALVEPVLRARLDR